ncbi:hypothetical protein BVC80_285g72 [Macleaya cordata]|uniref:Uncharacterized protein n=1 Tax=Macleaya cordata TaxID=56857 RepID=A0A200QSB7_MACCD|nr:hypothetical protein BVC80_285g72 [Macleaya cordata]
MASLILLISTLPLLLLLLLLYFYFATASPLPYSLLAFNCTLPIDQQQSIEINKLADPTSSTEATQTSSLTNSTLAGVVVEPDWALTSHLGVQCTLCISKAKHGVSMLCPESKAVTASFGGCYVHFIPNYYSLNYSNNMMMTYHVMDRIPLNSALDTFLLKLRTFGLTDCVRLASPKECELCLEERIKKLKQNGMFVDGYCVVLLEESNRQRMSSDSGSGGSDVVRYYDESTAGDGSSVGFKGKVVWWGWGVGVACLIGVVLGAWLMRRNVVNAAKVAATFSDSSEPSDEYIDRII